MLVQFKQPLSKGTPFSGAAPAPTGKVHTRRWEAGGTEARASQGQNCVGKAEAGGIRAGHPAPHSHAEHGTAPQLTCSFRN